MLGILFLGLIGGIAVAAGELVMGGGMASAIINYLIFGTVFTLVAAGLAVLRAIAAEKPRGIQSAGLTASAIAE